MACIGALALAAIFLLIIGEVASRNLFNAPFLGAVDRIEWLLPFAVSLGVAAAQANGEHFRMDIGINLLRGRARSLVEAVTHLMSGIFITVVCFYISGSAHQSWSVGDVSQDIEWPLWPPKLFIGLILALLAIRLILQSISFLQVTFTTNPDKETAS